MRLVDTANLNPEVAYHRITQILGCKWSLHILQSIQEGLARPNQMVKASDGLAERVLHRCLNRLEADGLLQKVTFPEIPPRVEYSLTGQGTRLLGLLHDLRSLAGSWTGIQGPLTTEEIANLAAFPT